MKTEYTIRAFPVAELPVPGWECFFGRHDVSFHTLVFYVWVVQGNGKTIVIDSGPPPGDRDMRDLVEACQRIDPKSLMRRVRSLEDVYSEAGIRAAHVDYLLITQPITYHSGGLLADAFPNSTVFLSRAGFLEFVLDNPGHPPRQAYFTACTWMYLRTLLIENRLVLTDSPVEVEPGISFETTGGHHPGSAAVKIDTARGRVAILETAFLKQNIDDSIPVGVAENAALCRQTIRRYVAECELVLAAHDSTIFSRFPGGQIA
jgi:glyoxylase-like metal-dependent hydrolase (beta-lactamase superfamily II)